MAIAERIRSYSIWVGQTNYLQHSRTIRLSLESGTTVYIGFPQVRPVNWLVFGTGTINVYMTADQYADVYHLLQTEDPVFFTAIILLGFRVGAVHSQLDLSLGEETGEGYDDQSLEALIVRAQKQATQTPPAGDVRAPSG
jgi:hypothetical protein